jgi:hypothetical protein
MKRVCLALMVLVLLAAQAVPALAGEAVLHSRAGEAVLHSRAGEAVLHSRAGEAVLHSRAGEAVLHSRSEDDEWGAEGFTAEQAPEDVQVELEGALMTSMARPRQTTGGTLTRLPLYFVENQGQVDGRVGYYVLGKDKTLYFTSQGLTFVLAAERLERERKAGSGEGWAGEAVQLRWIVKLDFVGANQNVQPLAQDETAAVVSYFKGQPEDWVTGLKTYSRVVYRDLWPGIDLEYLGTVSELKYQFVVRPGADPSQIRLAYRGAEVAIGEAGALEVSTPAGGFQDGAPYAYQELGAGEQVQVEVSYEFPRASHEAAYGFHIGAYDPSRVLVLDPVVLFSCGYIGGSLDDEACGIAVDSEGNVYVTGHTDSTAGSFPEKVGPDLTHNGDRDAFVAKVRAGGASLAYCGYIGGLQDDEGKDVAVDSEGRAHVTGFAQSTQTDGFPVTVGPDLSQNGSLDAFVARVSADGTSLEYCGYIGGDAADSGYGIALGGSGCAYIAGSTTSHEGSFPVTIGPDLSYNGRTDAFVAKVRSDGMGLLYCGYLGGSGDDCPWDIAVSSAGRAYAVGRTDSSETEGFPVKVGPDLNHNGYDDAFVAKVRADGTGLVYCGYVGGSREDCAYGVALDSAGCAYMTGTTFSSPAQGFPVSVGPELTYDGEMDVFVAKVESTGTALAYCGYIGGSLGEAAEGIAVDGDGCAYVCGGTQSSELEGFPVVGGPDLTHNGSADAFVAKVRADGTWFDYCSYIGGASSDFGADVALEQVGDDYAAHIAGSTRSSETEGFPVTLGPDLSHNDGLDAFVARVGPNHAPTLGTIVPASGGSAPGQHFVITTSWRDVDGWRDLKHVYFHIGDSPSLAGNVTLMYNRAKHRLWIRSDDGSAWQGGCTPGDMTIIANSQAAVYCFVTQVSYSGTDRMNVAWYMWFLPGFTGAKKTGLKCKDRHKAKAKGAWIGTWTVMP